MSEQSVRDDANAVLKWTAGLCKPIDHHISGACERLARVVLAEHSADEEMPVTAELLLSLGFRWCEEHKRYDSLEVEGGDQLSIMIGESVCESYFGYDDGAWVYVPPPKMLGDLRRLCRALGIPLAEKAHK